MTTATTTPAAEPSAWAPLGLPLFRALWIATLASNVGTWMHDVGAGWLMTSLSPSPVMVAMVQTATSLPVFLIGIPAGALADIVDRRRYLIVLQLWMAIVAATLAWCTFTGLMTPWLLVLLTFAMGVGSAMMMPAWASITPEIVPRAMLQPAVALNSMGINVARAIGPAIAGVIIASLGNGAVFALNALSFAGVIAVLVRWERAPAPSTLPTERFFSALRAGLRYARHAPALHAAVIRGAGFFAFASASWALLPLVARRLEDGGPGSFGVLVAAVGVGAVTGAVLLPKVKARVDRDRLVAGSTTLYALAMVGVALLDHVAPLAIAMAISGVAWIGVLSSLQVAAQLALPNWVRSRGLAVFMTVFMGSMALGSLAWGQLASAQGITVALLTAATGMVLVMPLTWRWQLAGGDSLELTPSMHWPTPSTHDGVTHDRGPVLITIEYEVAAEHTDAFVAALCELQAQRRRDGAFAWALHEHTDRPNHFIETFSVESWLEHLRQHERVTDSDRVAQEAILALLVPGTKPKVEHYVAPDWQHMAARR